MSLKAAKIYEEENLPVPSTPVEICSFFLVIILAESKSKWILLQIIGKITTLLCAF